MTAPKLPTPLDYRDVDDIINMKTHFYTHTLIRDEDGEITELVFSAARPRVLQEQGGVGNFVKNMFDLYPNEDEDDYPPSDYYEGYVVVKHCSKARDWDEFENLPPEFTGVYT